MSLIMLLILLLSWRYLLWWPRPLTAIPKHRPLLLGHRGVRGSLPENTLVAFRKALDEGLDGIECDVQRSADGQLLLFHDLSLSDERRVSQLSWQELRLAQADMPRLEDLLELAKAYPQALLNLEIKTDRLRTQGLEQALVRAVLDADLASRCLISSFNPLALLKVRLLAPGLRTALLFAPDMPWWLASGWLAGWLHVDAIHPYHQQLSAAMIKRARGRGLMVNTWTVNEDFEVFRVHKLAVDGIIADDPVRLKQAIRP
jgi:glycerophosphoryl diester phosphodiesterase